jgi:hypothetical protein
MTNTIKKLSYSLRKYVAHQKSLIRKQTSNAAKQAELIKALYEKVAPKAEVAK